MYFSLVIMIMSIGSFVSLRALKEEGSSKRNYLRSLIDLGRINYQYFVKIDRDNEVSINPSLLASHQELIKKVIDEGTALLANLPADWKGVIKHIKDITTCAAHIRAMEEKRKRGINIPTGAENSLRVAYNYEMYNLLKDAYDSEVESACVEGMNSSLRLLYTSDYLQGYALSQYTAYMGVLLDIKTTIKGFSRKLVMFNNLRDSLNEIRAIFYEACKDKLREDATTPSFSSFPTLKSKIQHALQLTLSAKLHE